MIWRVLLTVLYACGFGALVALENSHPSMPDGPLIALWLTAPLIGFLVGRWWVLLVVVGALAGRVIGWDPGENDGNPALWPPYVVATVVIVGLPLAAGVAFSQLWRRRPARSQGSRTRRSAAAPRGPSGGSGRR